MQTPPRRPALVCNRLSGSYDAGIAATIEQICRDAGHPLVRIFHIPDDELPGPGRLSELAIDLLMVWTGDGTINAAAGAATRWDGAIVPLPGGTQNLLSKALHGDRPAPDIVRDIIAGNGRQTRPPIIHSAAGDAYITVAAGPATRWAEIRETLRRDGLLDAGQAVPDTVAQTFEAPGVRIGKDGTEFQAIILTPTRDGIRAAGVIAGSVTDLLQHGLAWLGGDYRDGPSEPIITDHNIRIESSSMISIELDGELKEIAAPASFESAISPVNLVSTAALSL